MSLSDFNFKRIYRSKNDELDRDFIIPALRRSTSYDRGTGYFSLSSLANFTNGLIPFIRSGGNIRLVTSVDLNPEDRVIIQKGLAIQESSVITKLNNDILVALEDSIDLLKLDVITNLIAANRLIIKIAYIPCGGIYHEKIGFLKDSEANKVCFIGSQNETYSGYNLNLESAVVLTSWTGDSEDIAEQESYFEDLWNNRVQGLKVFSFPEAVMRSLFNKYKHSGDLEKAIERLEQAFTSQLTSSNKVKELYPYQDTAIKQFISNGYCHFYEMATGTGKTFTAVKTVEALFEQKGKLSVIVLVPQIDLQAQWQHSFAEIGINSYLFGGLASSVETEKNFDSFIISSFMSDFPVVGISTYDTFFAKLSTQMKNLPTDKMIIIDEAHNLSPNQIANLPEQFPYRLGLSATPERFSVAETTQIVEYFTRGIIETYKYTIEEAIENNFLSHYLYFPIFVNISNENFEDYQSYTRQLIYLENEDPRDEEKIVDIRTKRSVIIKKASCKMDRLRTLVTDGKYNFQNSVIYCGQGKDSITEESIIDSVTKILAVYGHYNVSQFTSKTGDRVKVLSEFERGYYDVLAAIKCFDEGVDIPKLDKIYIMASDTLTRQTIQRRGRVLRKCTETGKTIAYIYDFVVLPPEDVTAGMGVRPLVVNELRRVREYTRLADNRTKINKELEAICSFYGIEEENRNETEFDENN
ncbi:MAG: DEAD/DEAH box helicase family protein [Bacillota bacterium]|nr:DEAD/DEAH box helicase family protein [Bacillota bacterium]